MGVIKKVKASPAKRAPVKKVKAKSAKRPPKRPPKGPAGALDVRAASKHKSALQALLKSPEVKALDKIYDLGTGASIFHIASSTKRAPRWPTGIIPLDYTLGGGWMRGRFHMIYGPESSGKTYTCLKSIAEVQQRCSRTLRHVNYDAPRGSGDPYREPLCLYIVAEADWDPVWAEACGVDLDRLVLVFASQGAKALDVACTMVDRAFVDLIVIDSLACLVPDKERVESVSTVSVGAQARLIGKGIRKLMCGLTEAYERSLNGTDERVPTLLITNQIRFKIGGFGNPESVSGGQAPRYAISSMTRLGAGKKIQRTDKSHVKLFEAACVNQKNKTFRPGAKGTYTIVLGDHEDWEAGDCMDEPQLMAFGIKAGVILKGGKWTIPSLDREFRVKADLISEMVADREFKHQLKLEVWKVLLQR